MLGAVGLHNENVVQREGCNFDRGPMKSVLVSLVFVAGVIWMSETPAECWL